jgi:hypothetical protein
MNILRMVVMISQTVLTRGDNLEVIKSTPTCPFTCWVYAAPSRMKVAKIYSDSSKEPGIVFEKNFLPMTSPVVSNISGMRRDMPRILT